MAFRLAGAISAFALVSAAWTVEEDLNAFEEYPEPRGAVLSARASPSVEVYRIPLDRPIVEGLDFGIHIELDPSVKDAQLIMSVGQEVGSVWENLLIGLHSDIKESFVFAMPSKPDKQLDKIRSVGLSIYQSGTAAKPGHVESTYVISHALKNGWAVFKNETQIRVTKVINTRSYGNVLRVVAKKITVKQMFQLFQDTSTLLPIKPEGIPVGVTMEFPLLVLPLFDKTRSYSIAFIDPLPSHTIKEAPIVLKSDHRFNQHTVSCFSLATNWTRELPAALPNNTKVGDILVFKFVRVKSNVWNISVNGSTVATYTTCVEAIKLIKISPELQPIRVMNNGLELMGFKPPIPV